MRVTLSDREVRALQSASATLLSPLDHASSEAWLAEASREISALLGADQALTMVPVPDHGPPIMTGFAYDIRRAVEDYRDGIMQYDTGLHVKRQQLGLEVYHREHVYEPGEFRRTPVYGDWALPHRLLDVIGMGFNPIAGDPVAALHFYHDRDHEPEDPESDGAFGARGLALLELLLPAWKAGVQQHLTFTACRHDLARMFDHLADGVAIYDRSGREHHRNRALERLLAADPDGHRLVTMIRSSAERLARAHGRSPAEAPEINGALALNLATRSGRYTIETSHTRYPGLGRDLAILVVVRPHKARPFSDDDLKQRFQLTPRECQTAHLLAAGKSNVEVAAALGVTGYTARRHTEGVLRKLGVTSRAAVGPVCCTAGKSAPPHRRLIRHGPHLRGAYAAGCEPARGAGGRSGPEPARR